MNMNEENCVFSSILSIIAYSDCHYTPLGIDCMHFNYQSAHQISAGGQIMDHKYRSELKSRIRLASRHTESRLAWNNPIVWSSQTDRQPFICFCNTALTGEEPRKKLKLLLNLKKMHIHFFVANLYTNSQIIMFL